MIQSYLKRTIIFVLILIHIQASLQDYNHVFTIEKIDTSSYECGKSEARYTFNIIGHWNLIPVFMDIYFNVIAGNKKVLLIV